MKAHRIIFAGVFGLLVLVSMSCRQTSPPRDQIPALRERLAKVQEVIKGRNPAQVDSLFSSQIRREAGIMDSLYLFVYGADLRFPFYRFADYQIVYNQEKARIDCLLSDSLGEQTRPVTLTFVLEGKRWQLKRWEPRADSISTSTE